MVILISGATHTGKTNLAQKLMEKYKYPYLSIDHLKMGLINNNYTTLTPDASIEELTNFLWPIICEIIKVNIENKQNIIIEGCYIPFNYQSYFKCEQLKLIKYVCLVFTKQYITSHFETDIVLNESIIEDRAALDITMDGLIKENDYYYQKAIINNVNYYLITKKYRININELARRWLIKDNH